MPGLRVDRIDPKAETARYVEKIMATRVARPRRRRPRPAARGPALPLLPRRSRSSTPSRGIVARHAAASSCSTPRRPATRCCCSTRPAPTTGEMMRNLEGRARRPQVVTPLMRLRDPAYTQVLLVTLPETTPVRRPPALQEDLRRAGIEPFTPGSSTAAWLAAGAPTRCSPRRAGPSGASRRVRGTAGATPVVLPWQAEPRSDRTPSGGWPPAGCRADRRRLNRTTEIVTIQPFHFPPNVAESSVIEGPIEVTG